MKARTLKSTKNMDGGSSSEKCSEHGNFHLWVVLWRVTLNRLDLDKVYIVMMVMFVLLVFFRCVQYSTKSVTTHISFPDT